MSDSSLEIAVEDFINAHKPKFLDIDFINEAYGSVAEFINAEGQPTGDLGRVTKEIPAHHHKDNVNQTVEWYIESFQIAYYKLAFADRISREDHTPYIFFDPNFDFAMGTAKELVLEGNHDLTFTRFVEGCPIDSENVHEYLEN